MSEEATKILSLYSHKVDLDKIDLSEELGQPRELNEGEALRERFEDEYFNLRHSPTGLNSPRHAKLSMFEEIMIAVDIQNGELTIDDAAEHMNVSKTTVYKIINTFNQAFVNTTCRIG